MKSNKIKMAVFSAVAISLAATGYSMSASNEIADRKAAMKQVGNAMKVLGPMAKGETTFDGAAALTAFQVMQDAVTGVENLFPAGSETGGETTADPAIWSDNAGFMAAMAKFQSSLDGATSAGVPADLAAMQATFGSVAQNCGACHKAYRVSKN